MRRLRLASLALLAYNNRPVAESIPVPLDGVRAAVEGIGGMFRGE